MWIWYLIKIKIKCLMREKSARESRSKLLRKINKKNVPRLEVFFVVVVKTP